MWGDGPAAFLTLIIGALVVIGALSLQFSLMPPWWVHVLIWPGVSFTLVIPWPAHRQGRAPPVGVSQVKRIPLIPTLLVAVAVAVMIALGLWQLERRGEKEALIAQLAANQTLPPMAYPELAPVADAAMFRKARVTCLRVTGWRVTGGSTPSGKGGYRHIAECVTGAEGPGALIDMGVAADPTVKPGWRGGVVDGLITTEPNQTSLIARAFGKASPLRPMLVADVPAPGLAASAPPSPNSITNNHLAYAVQWFLFAAVALVIYAIAVRRRPKAGAVSDAAASDQPL